MLSESMKEQLRKKININRENISTWIKDHADKCGKCGSTEVIFYKKWNAKIDRYAVACKKCGTFFGWLPNVLMPEIPAEDIISEVDREILKGKNYV